ncbi:MAG: SurA N-terminal domain-containing protein [Deltaproteobacteria bacterium]|nr:SurA N-terminal domain-containing protein [Deltaproteobacteria bacterium]
MPRPLRLRKAALAAGAVLFAAALPVLGVYLFQEHYKKQLWDPGHAALVNGRPILSEQVETVLKVGLYPPLSSEGGKPGTVSMRQILDKLIEEELVLQAAERSGLTVSDSEVENFLEAHLKAWGCGEGARAGYMCRLPKGEELESLTAALRQRLLLEKAAAFAAGSRGRRAAREWEGFLEEWVRAHAVPRAYEVRALLAEKTPAALKALRKARGRAGGLDAIEAALKSAGAGCVLSRPLALDPVKAAGVFSGTPDLAAALTGAAADPARLTQVLELQESYAVLEVLTELAQPSPEEIVRAARAGYEGRVAEAAFRVFLDDLYAEADIEINPNFPGASPAETRSAGTTGQTASAAGPAPAAASPGGSGGQAASGSHAERLRSAGSAEPAAGAASAARPLAVPVARAAGEGASAHEARQEAYGVAGQGAESLKGAGETENPQAAGKTESAKSAGEAESPQAAGAEAAVSPQGLKAAQSLAEEGAAAQGTLKNPAAAGQEATRSSEGAEALKPPQSVVAAEETAHRAAEGAAEAGRGEPAGQRGAEAARKEAAARVAAQDPPEGSVAGKEGLAAGEGAGPAQTVAATEEAAEEAAAAGQADAGGGALAAGEGAKAAPSDAAAGDKAQKAAQSPAPAGQAAAMPAQGAAAAGEGLAKGAAAAAGEASGSGEESPAPEVFVEDGVEKVRGTL